MQKKYNGVVVPVMTPFTERLEIDEPAVERLVNHIITGGCFPFILGTTGEAPSISRSGRKRLMAATAKAVNRRCTLYTGISSNSFHDSVEEAKIAHDLGADVCVSTMPCYYPAEPEQMLRYYTDLAGAIPCPLIVYNIPSTTHLSIPIDVVEQLSHHPNIVGFKDSERGEERMTKAISLWKDRSDFCYLAGWAAKSQTAIEMGADGIVPSSGNLVPSLFRLILDAIHNGDGRTATAAQQKTDRISEKYQKDRTLIKSFSAFKVMLSAYGLCGPAVLPPLYRLDAAEEKTIAQSVLTTFGSLEEINSLQKELIEQTNG